MKKIANIVSEVDLVNHNKLNWINYHSKLSECDLNIPTLIIGWNIYREMYKNIYPNILQKKNPNNPNIWWEFSMKEKIVDHFNGIEDFIKKAPRQFCNSFKYVSIDPIKDSIIDEEDLIKRIPTRNSIYYQYKDEIIYVFNRDRSTIYGIYLNSFKYFKYDIKKITDLLFFNIKDKKIDSDGNFYREYYKEFPEFDQLKRSMVLFLI